MLIHFATIKVNIVLGRSLTASAPQRPHQILWYHSNTISRVSFLELEWIGNGEMRVGSLTSEGENWRRERKGKEEEEEEEGKFSSNVNGLKP